jgi:hypothetical protein
MSAPARPLPCRRVRILFLGQCLQYGYEDVDRASTFVALAAAGLGERFPAHDLRRDLKHLYHPRGLRAILRHRLWLSKPDIVVISVVGSFAAAPTRVNLLYEIAPEVVDTARSFLQKLEARRRGRAVVEASTSLDEFIAWHPPIALDEYEALVREGVEMCQSAGCDAVLLGPGRFNEDTTDGTAGLAPDLWFRVNEMVRRIGRSLDVTAIDTLGALSQHGGEVFLPNNIRWSRFGHRVVAHEVESVLASRVAALHLPVV